MVDTDHDRDYSDERVPFANVLGRPPTTFMLARMGGWMGKTFVAVAHGDQFVHVGWLKQGHDEKGWLLKRASSRHIREANPQPASAGTPEANARPCREIQPCPSPVR